MVKVNNAPKQLTDLPPELICNIASNFSLKDMNAARQVRTFRDVMASSAKDGYKPPSFFKKNAQNEIDDSVSNYKQQPYSIAKKAALKKTCKNSMSMDRFNYNVGNDPLYTKQIEKEEQNIKFSDRIEQVYNTIYDSRRHTHNIITHNNRVIESNQQQSNDIIREIKQDLADERSKNKRLFDAISYRFDSGDRTFQSKKSQSLITFICLSTPCFLIPFLYSKIKKWFANHTKKHSRLHF